MFFILIFLSSLPPLPLLSTPMFTDSSPMSHQGETHSLTHSLTHFSDISLCSGANKTFRASVCVCACVCVCECMSAEAVVVVVSGFGVCVCVCVCVCPQQQTQWWCQSLVCVCVVQRE